MKAISLWQPWAWAILFLGKDVENRVWRTHYRGPLLLHAAKRRPTADECLSFLDLAEEITGVRGLNEALATIDEDAVCNHVDAMRALPRGGIVGSVDVIGCKKGYPSPWAMHGQYQWVLGPFSITLPFKPYKGERGFFEVDYDGLEVPSPPPKKQLDLL